MTNAFGKLTRLAASLPDGFELAGIDAQAARRMECLHRDERIRRCELNPGYRAAYARVCLFDALLETS